MNKESYDFWTNYWATVHTWLSACISVQAVMLNNMANVQRKFFPFMKGHDE